MITLCRECGIQTTAYPHTLAECRLISACRKVAEDATTTPEGYLVSQLDLAALREVLTNILVVRDSDMEASTTDTHLHVCPQWITEEITDTAEPCAVHTSGHLRLD